MSFNEKEPHGQAGQEADRRLSQEYREKYFVVQKEILKTLPDEAARLDWVGRFGAAFHDLAASDPSFHDLVMSPSPDAAEIRRRIEESAAEKPNNS